MLWPLKRRSFPVFSILAASFIFLLMISAPLLNSSEAAGESKSGKPLQYNRDQLVKMAVIGYIAPARFGDTPYHIDPDGKVHVLPGTGSITYNFRCGDSAINIAGDHVEPAVTLYNLGSSGSRSSPESRGLNTLSCIGNKVRVLTGEAKGEEGSEHVMVDFADDTVLEKLTIGDKMQIYAIGVGLELMNVEGVKAMNVSPHLLEVLTKRGMGVTEEGKLRIPVTHRIPAKIMGSGLGSSQVYRGDYDIQLFDEKTIKEHKLESLRFGDIVAIIDADHSYGRIYREGAISIGVISHSRSVMAGHGPGVTTLFTSPQGKIDLFITPEANLSKLLNIR
jgi:hypothetical protein